MEYIKADLVPLSVVEALEKGGIHVEESLSRMYKNTGIKWIYQQTKKRLKPLVSLGLSLV